MHVKTILVYISRTVVKFVVLVSKQYISALYCIVVRHKLNNTNNVEYILTLRKINSDCNVFPYMKERICNLRELQNEIFKIKDRYK